MWRWLVLLVVGACGGGGGSDSGASGDDDDNTINVDPNGINCNDAPVFELQSMDCIELGVAWGDQYDLSRECTKDEDCRTIHPDCRNWDQVFCYYAVNCQFSDAAVQQYNSFALSQNCVEVDGIRINACECPAAPPSACINGQCNLVIEYPY